MGLNVEYMKKIIASMDDEVLFAMYEMVMRGIAAPESDDLNEVIDWLLYERDMRVGADGGYDD